MFTLEVRTFIFSTNDNSIEKIVNVNNSSDFEMKKNN